MPLIPDRTVHIQDILAVSEILNGLVHLSIYMIDRESSSQHITPGDEDHIPFRQFPEVLPFPQVFISISPPW